MFINEWHKMGDKKRENCSKKYKIFCLFAVSFLPTIAMFVVKKETIFYSFFEDHRRELHVNAR